MADFSFSEVAKALTHEEETGVSFEGRTEKWGSAEEVKSLIEAIDNCKDLIYLNLDGNTLGVEAAKCIGTALTKHPEFKKALWKNLFTGRLKEEIPKALRHLGDGMLAAGAHLTIFDCSDNALGPNGMKGLVDLFSGPTCYSLQELRLNNCGLGIGGGKMLAQSLLECYKKSCKVGTPLTLKVFIAGRNRLENDGAKALAEVFATIKTLEVVAMPQNGIYHEGISALSEGFKMNPNMRILDLNDNTIQVKGAAALSNALPMMPKLHEINFGDCLIKTKGAIMLSDALQNHTELETINLSFNEIGPDGGYAIINALMNKTKIKSISLGGNQFGEECCESLQDMMIGHTNPNALGSLSDDEYDGDDDYNDENDDDDNDGQEEEVSNDEDDETDVEQYTVESDEDEEDDGEEAGDNYVTALNEKSLNTTIDQFLNSSSKSISFAGEQSRPNTVETFCNTPNPSLQMFNALEETDKIEAFRNYLKELKDDDYLIALVFTTLKCAALSEESNEALDVAIELYKDAFDYAVSTRQVSRVKNFFLIQLGLLKCEDKKFSPSYNMKSCRNALKETMTKHTFPEDITKTFDLFLERFA